MSDDIHQGELQPNPAPVARHKRTGRELRWERRRRRIWFEEILGWILVPVILIGCYWVITAVLGLFGLTIDSAIEGGRQVLQAVKGR